MDEAGRKAIVDRVSACLSGDPGIAAAFVFGSAATGRLTEESDVDVGVYFQPRIEPDGKCTLEIEEEGARHPQEEALWGSLERALERTVDLVVLNHAPAAVAASVVLNGIPCFVRDEALLARYARAVVPLAEDFRDFSREFAEVRKRSGSLSEIDRGRLSSLAAVGGFEAIADELAAFSEIRYLLAHECLDARYPEIQRIAGRSREVFGALVSATQTWLLKE